MRKLAFVGCTITFLITLSFLFTSAKTFYYIEGVPVTDFFILKDIPISETELKKQLEEIIEMDKKAKRASINLCKDWLEKLNNGAKVKEL